MDLDRRVLVIDDDRSACEILRAELTRRDFLVVTRASAEEALRLLAEEDFGLIVTDINMDGMDGVEMCRRAIALRNETPVVLMTANATVEAAIAAIRAGAYDFVMKPLDVDELVLTIERALRLRALRREVKRLRTEVSEQNLVAALIGESDPMSEMYDVILRAASTESTVLVSGESGTGKELVAKALHAKSRRFGGPFVAINCAAMPEHLLESELFGHVKGAFTDAHGARPGLFVKASGGTLLLDEIGDMPLGMQTKLLRALQERTVRPVGSDTEVAFDTRIVASSNRDLEADVSTRHFREDLFYRINVLQVAVPPLRARGNDILVLAQHFLMRGQTGATRPRVLGMTNGAAECLLAYAWPGNVRELQNCIERAVALAMFDHLRADDLPARVRPSPVPAPEEAPCTDPARLLSMAEIELRHILRVISAAGGNKALAARVLGMDRRTLYRKLDKPRYVEARSESAVAAE